MKLGYSKNEHGTKISLHKCDVCGNEFSLCPAQEGDDTCGFKECASYDPNRDVGKLLREGATLEKVYIQ